MKVDIFFKQAKIIWMGTGAVVSQVKELTGRMPASPIKVPV